MTFANYESIDPYEQDLARMSNHSVYPSNSITTSFNKRQDEPEKPKSSLPPQSSPEKTPTSKTTTTTMTDSGITHTIPNDNPVTVTMHTTITQGMSTSTPPTNATKPETAQTSAIDGASGAVSPSTTSSAPGEPGNDGNKDISTGAVVGIAISGAIVFVVLCILFFMWRRRKRNGTQYSDSTHQETTTSQEAVLGEKDYPWPLSNTRHSSHHAGRANHSSGDPFGPFGGRADKPFDPYRPPSNTFEMDGVDTAVTELPAAAPDSEPKAEQSNESAAKRTPTGPVDPRATLSDLRNEDGGPAYVNQWNQYVVLARQRDGDSKQGEF